LSKRLFCFRSSY